MGRQLKTKLKPRPTKVYRIERRGEAIINFSGKEVRHPKNSTEQYFNKPYRWPGPSTSTIGLPYWEGTVTYLEGTITWES